MKGFFAGTDYVHQHWTNLARSVDLKRRRHSIARPPDKPGPWPAANATRPILPVNGGVRAVNVLMNLGVSDYDGLQTEVSYRGHSKIYAGVSYTCPRRRTPASRTATASGRTRAASRGLAKKSADRACWTSVTAR
jgi:hypothetical protein